MSAADTLREAADRLEGLAKGATPGPWEVHRASDDHVGFRDKAGFFSMMKQSTWGTKSDAAYIAAMSPEVGLALAAWLRHVADQEAAGWTGVPALAHRDHALAVARVILGGVA